MALTKIVSWNVNGIRAIIKKNFPADLKKIDPDILLLQETKAPKEDALNALSLFPDYEIYVNSSKNKKGYSGTAILSKRKPLDVKQDIGVEEHDQEGRVITAEFEDYFVVVVYVPNSGQGLKRLDYRQQWDREFLNYLKDLEKTKPVIVGGDLNVAHQEIDIARAKENYNKSAGYTQHEIDGFTRFIDSNFVDSFRSLHPDEVRYSYWNYVFSARDRDVGWRIDYFLVSKLLMARVKSASILGEYYGSDHCPVEIEIE